MAHKLWLGVVSIPDYYILVTCESAFPVILEFQHRAVIVVSSTPILLGLTCMLRVCPYRKGAREWEKRGVGNISFSWWRKPKCPERTTSQPQVTDNLPTYG